MKLRHVVALVCFLSLAAGGCKRDRPKEATLTEGRAGFQTKLVRRRSMGVRVPTPPRSMLRVVRYDSTAGKLAAYVSPAPGDGRRHPAILWLFGGFDNSIGETAWEGASADNDQSARAFRGAGIITMYPSLRGGNDNRGAIEGFYGEVDDVLYAAEYLAELDYVDPKRIYLGGHSTGGTLAMLVAESTDRFRAVFAFGPVRDVELYGREELPFDTSDDRELRLRSPILWLHAIRNPTFVFEGTRSPGNLADLEEMADFSENDKIRFHAVDGTDHFGILAPVTRLVAEKILGDTGVESNIAFSDRELSRAASR